MKTTISMFTILAAGTLLASAAVTPSGDSGLRSYLSDGSDREIEISSNLTIDLSYTDTKILEVNQTNTLTSSGTDVFTITGPTDGYFSITTSSSLTLSNITFSTFNLTESSYDYGAFLNAGTLTLNSSATLTSNSASGNGAAVFNSGTLNLNEGSTISNNSATNGGAIYNNGTTTSDGVKTITIAGTENAKTTIFGNSATNGGAIYNEVYGKISVSGNVEFSGNSASGNGGAIYNVGDGSSTDVSVSATFSKNTATSEGGAIYNSGTMTIAGTFSENSASDGGAIYNTNTISSLSADFTGNKATSGNGGAIYNDDGTISNLSGTFKGNSATSQGGAIYNTKGTITIVGNTEFTGNTAGATGAAIYNSMGTINLNPDENETITFNDSIGGSASTSATIELLASAAGTVYFNNEVRGNTVNVHGGKLVFGTFDGDTELGVAKSSGSIADNAALNIYGGLVDVGTLTLSNFTLDGGEITGTDYTIDSTGTLTAGTISGGIANVSGISSESTGTLNLSATTVKSSGNISFAGTLNLSGTLEFTGTSATTLSAGTLNLTGTIKLADSQALTVTGTFNPTGNAKISGGEIASAIELTSGQALTLDNTKLSQTTTVKSGATLTVLGGTLDQAITNSGTLNLNPGENGSVVVNGAVSGFDSSKGDIDIRGDETGTVTINSKISYSYVTLYSGTLVLDESFDQLNSHFYIKGGTITGAGALKLTGSALSLQDNATFKTANATLSSRIVTANAFSNVGSNVSYILENVTAENLTSGAIYHNTTGDLNLKIYGGTFENNSSSNGGAIYNEKTLTLVSDATHIVKFSGNTANSASNAIHNKGTIYMNVDGSYDDTGHTGLIKFDDAITGSSGTIYVNASTDASGNAISAGTTGTVEINAAVSGNTVYLCGGTIYVSESGSVSDLKVDGTKTGNVWTTETEEWGTFTYYSGPTISLKGSLGNVTLTNNATLLVSVLERGDFDSISVAQGSTLIVSASAPEVTLSATADIVVKGVTGIEDYEITVVDLGTVSVIGGWSFDIANSGAEVTVSMQLGEGLDETNNLVVLHSSDGTTWENWTSTVKPTYDSSTGNVSFTTTSFSSYAIAFIPEPSSFGLLAGSLALLLAGTRRRRKGKL